MRSATLRLLALVAVVLLIGGAAPVQGQGAFAHGAVVALQGTPHLWVADAQGVLHWGGDTRALAGKHVNWNDRRDVSLAELQTFPIGDPWLSAGLLKDGDPIYQVKWETEWPLPKLLHIQRIEDVEIFGIWTANYGNYVIDKAAWEQRYGIEASTLERHPLASAVPPGVTLTLNRVPSAPPPPPAPAPAPAPVSDQAEVYTFGGTAWGGAYSRRTEGAEITITEQGLHQRVLSENTWHMDSLAITTRDFVFRATGRQLGGVAPAQVLISLGGPLTTLPGSKGGESLNFIVDLNRDFALLQRHDNILHNIATVGGTHLPTDLIQPGQPFTLEVLVQDQHITGSINGVKVLSAYDPLFTHTQIGLGTFPPLFQDTFAPFTIRWESAELRYLTDLRQFAVDGKILQGWRKALAGQEHAGPLLYALKLLWAHNVDGWRQRVGKPLAERGVQIRWGNLPDGVGGRYEPAQKRITISESYIAERISVLTALMAHEVIHAVQPRTSLDPADCFEEELIAFTWQAMVWKELRPSLKWFRSPKELRDGEQDSEAVYDAWQAGELSQVVLSLPGYQLQCLGRVLQRY